MVHIEYIVSVCRMHIAFPVRLVSSMPGHVSFASNVLCGQKGKKKSQNLNAIIMIYTNISTQNIYLYTEHSILTSLQLVSNYTRSQIHSFCPRHHHVSSLSASIVLLCACFHFFCFLCAICFSGCWQRVAVSTITFSMNFIPTTKDQNCRSVVAVLGERNIIISVTLSRLPNVTSNPLCILSTDINQLSVRVCERVLLYRRL